MKRVLLIAAFVATGFFSYAQKVTGKVQDALTNSPLYGATITLAGKSAITDREGFFSVDCSKAGEITVSFVGYETFRQKIKNCNEELQVGLKPSGHTLDVVEISATSSQNKSLLYQPVSITKLTPAELKKGQGIFLDDAIQTSVPGVIMNRRTVSGGQQFNIRGYGNGSRGTRGI